MTFLQRAIDVGVLPADSPDLKVLKHVATGAVYALLFFGLTWLLTGFSPFRQGSLVVSSLFFLGILGSLARFIRTKDFERFVWRILVVGLAACFLGQIVLGGFAASSGAIFWGVIAPIGAVIFFGPDRAMRWFFAYVGLIVICVAIDPWIRTFAATPYHLSLTFFAVDTLGPATIGFLMIRYVDRQRRQAQARSEELLLNVLPAPIADRLKAGERTIALQHAEVSVLFADVVDFTPYAEATPPSEVVDLLNDLFSDFDALADRFGMEKIKTIGDAYMAVAGVPAPRPDHAHSAVRMALAMLETVHRLAEAQGRKRDLRVGIPSGPVVAGVIGRRKFAYDLWGDTVNTASRMESSGVPGCIQVTAETRAALGDAYPWQRRDGVDVKGKGPMTTYLLDPRIAPVPAGVPLTPVSEPPNIGL